MGKYFKINVKSLLVVSWIAGFGAFGERELMASEAVQSTPQPFYLLDGHDGKAPNAKGADRYSPFLAGTLNFLIPSTGFFYTRSYGWAAAQLALIGLGAALMLTAGPGVNSESGADYSKIIGGYLVMIGAYVGGVIAAPIVASHKNAVFRDHVTSQAPDTYGLQLAFRF